MKKIVSLCLSLMMILGLAACGNPQASDRTSSDPVSDNEDSVIEQRSSNILIAYDLEQEAVAQAAGILAEALDGDLIGIGNDDALEADVYEYVFLGFSAQDSVLPESVEGFLENHDFGARTIYPFVLGENNDPDAIFASVSEAQPGALMGGSALLFSEDTGEEEITAWAEGLEISGQEESLPENSSGDTVASAVVTPYEQQALYLWEEGNAPAETEYTVNNGRYTDDPDFRSYITSFPVPEGTQIKGAVLICPGGAFQFRSDQPEGIDVAEALSRLGYQSFVVDYRLRPYTQQEGALDLARAVRFVRAHAGDYGIDEQDIGVMGFSAGGILSGEMLLNFDGQVNGTALDAEYQPDVLDEISADAAACGMIYSFYGRLSHGTTDVDLLRSGNLPPTFYCYGTRDPFYEQFLANADAAEEAGVSVERLQLDDMPHGFGAGGGWIPAYDTWLSGSFESN